MINDCALKTETRYGKFPLGPSSVKVTVFASVATADPATITPLRPELPALTSRSIVATTSAEVNGVPSCHVTFWRSLKVHTLRVLSGAHDNARPGAMSVALGARVHRNSKDCAVIP